MGVVTSINLLILAFWPLARSSLAYYYPCMYQTASPPIQTVRVFSVLLSLSWLVGVMTSSLTMSGLVHHLHHTFHLSTIHNDRKQHLQPIRAAFGGFVSPKGSVVGRPGGNGNGTGGGGGGEPANGGVRTPNGLLSPAAAMNGRGSGPRSSAIGFLAAPGGGGGGGGGVDLTAMIEMSANPLSVGQVTRVAAPVAPPNGGGEAVVSTKPLTVPPPSFVVNR